MSRTFSALFVVGAPGIVLPTAQVGAAAGNAGIIRNGTGDLSWNNVAGVATQNYFADLSVMTRPYITYPADFANGTSPSSNEFREVFGTAAGGPGNPYSGSPASPSSLAGSQFGQANIPWGLAVIDIFAVYSVQTVNLTSATLALNRNIFSENVAFTNTAVVAPTAVAATTTTSAGTPHVQKISLAQPLVFETADISGLQLELVLTQAATSTTRVYGLGIHAALEYL